jgi:hypothetical protein
MPCLIDDGESSVHVGEETQAPYSCFSDLHYIWQLQEWWATSCPIEAFIMSKSTYTHVRPSLKVRAEKKYSKIQDINNAELSSAIEADKSQRYNDPKNVTTTTEFTMQDKISKCRTAVLAGFKIHFFAVLQMDTIHVQRNTFFVFGEFSYINYTFHTLLSNISRSSFLRCIQWC